MLDNVETINGFKIHEEIVSYVKAKSGSVLPLFGGNGTKEAPFVIGYKEPNDYLLYERIIIDIIHFMLGVKYKFKKQVFIQKEKIDVLYVSRVGYENIYEYYFDITDCYNKSSRDKYELSIINEHSKINIKNIYDNNGYHKIFGIHYMTHLKYDKDLLQKDTTVNNIIEDGYDKNGYDSDGYNEDGYDKNGYDGEGYNEYGYDKNGYDSENIHRTTGTIYNTIGFDRNGYNEEGYDVDGYNKDGYNKNGFFKNGTSINDNVNYDNKVNYYEDEIEDYIDKDLEHIYKKEKEYAYKLDDLFPKDGDNDYYDPEDDTENYN